MTSEIALPHLATKRLGRAILHRPTVASTQDVLKQKLAEGKLNEGFLVLADRQEKGHGRLERTWIQIPGDQIFASILLRPRFPIERYPMISIAAGVALAQALEDSGVMTVTLKWPNDVLIAGKKVAGILGEVVSQDVVLGIGVNVSGNENKLPDSIRGTATTVESHLKSADRWAILSHFLNRFEPLYDSLQAPGTSVVKDEFNRRWHYKMDTIRIAGSSVEIFGTSDGIDDSGALLLRTPDGRLDHIVSGDVSVREALE